MTFSTIDFIFIDWICYDAYFCWVYRNFDFKPANEIFAGKCKIPIFQKTCFLGMTSKIEFEQNWSYGYVLYRYYGFHRFLIIQNFPWLLFINIGRSGRFIKKLKNHFFNKNHIFLDRKCALEGRYLVQYGSHISTESV